MRGARTHGLTKRTGRVRTYHGAAAPIGYHPYSQRARRVLGGDSRPYGNRVRWVAVRARAAARRLGYGTRVVVGARSGFLTPRKVLGGYSRGTHGPVCGRIRTEQWKGAMQGNRDRYSQGLSPRGGTANHTEYPTAPDRCRGRLPAYSRPRAARARARQCDGATHAHTGALTDTNSTGRSHAAAWRGIARRAGAQSSKLLELRQRGGDRAVERVRGERPATRMVRPALQ